MIDKPHLVLLPGQLCDEAIWGEQLGGLADAADMTVVDLTIDDSISTMAERTLGAAPPQFVLAGLSLGGYVAFEILRRAPDRVLALAIMNSSARPDTESQAVRREGNVRAARVGAFKGVTPRFLASILHPDHAADPVMAKTVLDMTERVGRRAFERQQNAIVHRPDSRPLLASIRCPTLIVGGRADRVTPPELQEEIAAAISGARLEILEICGHLAPLEQPNRINDSLCELLVRT